LNFKTSSLIVTIFTIYNIENGIYPIATSEEIEAAIGEYLTSPHEVDIQFDSFDREQVRNIIGR
jgi:hypothetical protein